MEYLVTQENRLKWIDLIIETITQISRTQKLVPEPKTAWKQFIRALKIMVLIITIIIKEKQV